MSDLSDPKHQAMLGFITAFVGSHGYGPTIREMQDGLGISSTAVVNYRMHILKREGRLEWQEGLSRTVRVVDLKDDGIAAHKADNDGIVIRLTGDEARLFHTTMGPGDPKALIMEAVRRDLRMRTQRPMMNNAG
jgi:SOS-response transcriptional repressor LexA